MHAQRNYQSARPGLAAAGLFSPANATFGESYAGAADALTAWCFGPGIVKAADVQTAWCFGLGIVKATDAQSALGIPQAA
jgi:hypothetical protein